MAILLKSPSTTRTAPISPVWLFAAGVLVSVSVWAFFRFPHSVDFETFYEEGADWLAGRALYSRNLESPNLNPPTATLLLFAPLAYLSLRGAQVAWVLLEIAGLAGSLAVLRRELPEAPMAHATCLLLICHGTSMALVQGQLTFLLLYPVTCAWAAYRNGRFVAVGLWLAPAIAIKPPLALLALGLPPLVWMAAGMGAGGLSAVALAVTRAATWRAWLAVSGRVEWVHLPFNASLWGMAARWSGVHTLSGLSIGTVAAVLIAGACLGWWTGREPQRDRRYLYAVLWSLLLSPLGWGYYLPLAFAPLLALSPTGWLFGAAYAITLLPFGGRPDLPLIVASLYGMAPLLAWYAVRRKDIIWPHVAPTNQTLPSSSSWRS